MHRSTSRRSVTAASGILPVLFLAAACADHPVPVAPLLEPSLAVAGVAQVVAWTGDGAPGGFCVAAASGPTRTWSFLLTSPDAAASSLTATFHEGEAATAARLDAFIENNIVLTANAAGAAGNLISARIVDAGVAFTPLSVSWTGTQLTVSRGTDAAGDATTTAAQLVAAVNAHPANLVTASLAAGSDGSGLAQAQAERSLTGGDAGAASLAVSFDDDVRFTATTAGSAGNATSVVIIAAGVPSAPLSVSISGSHLVVSLGTTASGAISTTAQQLAAAIGALPGAPVSAAALPGADGTGRVGALAESSLAGGGVEPVVNVYQAVGVRRGGGRSPFGYDVTTSAGARLLDAAATGGSRTSNLTVTSCD